MVGTHHRSDDTNSLQLKNTICYCMNYTSINYIYGTEIPSIISVDIQELTGLSCSGKK